MAIKLLKQLYFYARLMRLHRPIGILLLLWPTLWALWIASNGHPNLLVLVIFILGVVVMRSAGCVINDIADRKFDGEVARTKGRPLTAGQVSIKEALTLFIILLFVALGLVVLLNNLTTKLAVFGLIIAIIYPFMKRITHLPQLILGVAFAWGVPMAFAAQTNSLPGVAWLIFFIAALWPVAYDTMYAMVDKQDDLRIGVKSTAILFGSADRFIIGLIQIIILSLLIVLGILITAKIYYFIGVLIAALLFIYQQSLIKNRDPKSCFQAFLNSNWVGMIIFLGLVLNYL